MAGDSLSFQNLPGDMNSETISQIFGAIGYRVVKANIAPPKFGQTTTTATVQFASANDAKFVQENFNGANIPGFSLPLNISFAGGGYASGSGAAAMAAALAAMLGGGGGGGGGGYGKAPATKPAWGMGGGGMTPYDSEPQQSDNLYIKGLPGTADEAFVEQIFNQYGTVTNCRVLKKGDGPNCHAMVRFSSVEEAANIISTLNGGMLEGFSSALEISYAVSKSQQATQGMAMMAASGGPDGPTTEQMLDEWVKAKRMRDYAGADALRATLRAQGVDPDTERPKAW